MVGQTPPPGFFGVVRVRDVHMHIHFVRWLSYNDTTTRGQGRDDTRVFPIWVVMKFKFGRPIRNCSLPPNLGCKLKFNHDPNRDNSCVVPSLSAGECTTT